MSDDEIEILDSNTVNASASGNNDICQLCSVNLHGLSVAERQDHYDKHEELGGSIGLRSNPGKPKPTFVASTSQRKTTPMKSGKNGKDAAQDVFWHPTQAEAPPSNYSPGVLSILKVALKESFKKKAIKRAVLCYERTPHIFRELFDATWGCGYRNFLMACAALMDQQTQTLYFPHLDSPLPPGVQNLQQWIQAAWEHGYDEIGAGQLDHRLVETTKKIGTAELYVAFTSRKIPCVLVDINKGFDAVTDWVVNYFTEKPGGDVNQALRSVAPVAATHKMPVIMQLDGHSVTIVGYELGKNDKYNLLVFDPSSKIPSDIREAACNVSVSARPTPPSHSPNKSKRRERSKSPTSRKRPRTKQDPDDVLSIDSDDDKIGDARRALDPKSTVDADKVIKPFKLLGKYKKKKEYQLLYFTLGDPLTDQEQEDRKVVLSE